MKKVIVINQGDEYQAKVESKFAENTLFFDIFERAQKIVSEIIENNQSEESLCHTQKNYNLKGSNIIAFCAGRGQGKTSAMCSFAKQQAERNDVNFVSIDSIDPSSLEGGENIVRVLVSRLFYEFKNKYEKENGAILEEKEKNDIVRLFSEIYTNIDYLKYGQKKAEMQDDLEYLSNLGNSTVLKRNLGELIEKLLSVLGQKNVKEQYLLVQVDDMDLATGDVMRICEDIRNYFSISNMIILVAMNYDQVLRLISEKYMRQYEQLLRYEDVTSKKCYEMASKYLEKLLPVGHRLTLPIIDGLIAQQHDDFVLSYRNADGEVFEDLCHGKENVYTNLQEQLLTLIYHRTGLIFIKKEDKMHAILPHTLRELTHFVKLLSNMKVVDFEKLEAGNTEDKTFGEEIKKLKENLAEFKDYFMNEWCIQKLKKTAYRELLKHMEGQIRNNSAVLNLLKEFCGNNHIDFEIPQKNASYHVIRKMIDKSFENVPELIQAVDILYTIMLNDWFVTAVEKEGEYNKIIEFVNKPVELDGEYKKNVKVKSKGLAGNRNYYITNFDVHAATLRKCLNGGKLDSYAERLIRLFCTPASEEEEEEIVIKSGDEYILNPELTKLHFDLLQPLVTSAQEYVPGDENKAEEVQDSLDSETTNEITSAKLPYYTDARYVYANVDVQRILYERLQNRFENVSRKKKMESWNKIGREVWNEIGAVLNIPYLEIYQNLQKKYDLFSEQSIPTLSAIFLSNQGNRLTYIGQYKDNLFNVLEELVHGIIIN